MLSANLAVLLIVLLYHNVMVNGAEKKARRFSMMDQLLSLRNPILSIRESLKRSRQRMIERQQHAQICYDSIGCFDIPRKRSPLKRIPEHPDQLDTKFYLFRRDINFTEPIQLDYLNKSALKESPFNPTSPTKMIIHGYMSSWRDKGELLGAQAYLDIGDYNVILVDWEKGARGPHYSMAAANTEIVGRQTGFLLLNIIKLGTLPKDIHLIGFSLGAHIAGCASELLKDHGWLMGRITGLDPASPLFKYNVVREKTKKLDVSDAKFVDVIHTDGSPVFTDGFGILEPIGHVDFFPNGGKQQPGCVDGRNSVVMSHFDRGIGKDIACSHIRAWKYYLESLLLKASGDPNRCKFVAYPCKLGATDFSNGNCFPIIDPFAKYNEVGMLGEDASGYGPMYLVTRKDSPYCGEQLQASVSVSTRTTATRGVLTVQIIYENFTASFQVHCDLLDPVPAGLRLHSLGAAQFNTLNATATDRLRANLNYQSLDHNERNQTISTNLIVDKVQVKDMYGNSWQFCGVDTEIIDKKGDVFEVLSVFLTKKTC